MKKIAKQPSAKKQPSPDSTLNLVQKFIATVDLEDVFLKAITADCKMPPALMDPKDVKLFVNPSATFIKGEDNLLVWSTLKVEGIHKNEKAQAFIIEQVLGLIYRCDTKGFEDSVIGIFSKKNGTFNAWPYHRELLSSTMRRMGLPELVLPVMNPYRHRETQVEKKSKATT